MKLGMYALQGMGGVVVEAVKPAWVVTRKEPGPYPYFECLSIERVCEKVGARLLYNHEIWIPPLNTRCDLVLVATYDKIIHPAGVPIINLHPSIHWRGRNPMRHAIETGVETEGVTAHLITNGLDDGPVVMRYEIMKHEPRWKTEGELRLMLAHRMALCAKRIIDDWPHVTLTRNTLQDMQARAA